MHRDDIHGVQYLGWEEYGVRCYHLTFLVGIIDSRIIIYQHLVIESLALTRLRPGSIHPRQHTAGTNKQVYLILLFGSHHFLYVSSISRKACTRVLICPEPDVPYSTSRASVGIPASFNRSVRSGRS